ncbi:MAG: hypothetical protein AAF184_09825 [Pseudomonadota bacterium]
MNDAYLVHAPTLPFSPTKLQAPRAMQVWRAWAQGTPPTSDQISRGMDAFVAHHGTPPDHPHALESYVRRVVMTDAGGPAKPKGHQPCARCDEITNDAHRCGPCPKRRRPSPASDTVAQAGGQALGRC